MKKIPLIIALTFLMSNAFTQNLSELDGIITVTGSAEIVVPPDEIELEITLAEQSGWNDMSAIEKAFMKLLVGNDITNDKIIFNSSTASFYWYYWWCHRHDSRQSKTYVLKLNHKTDFMKLVRDLDKEYISSIRIKATSNKDIQKFRKEVKIEAIRAAKAKATYLLEAVDEELGRLITVEELQEINNDNNWYGQQQTNTYSNSVLGYNKSSRGGEYFENVPEIKLRYEIRTKFEIK